MLKHYANSPWKWVQSWWRQGNQRPIEAQHILSVACTGHGASLAYLGRDGEMRVSVLDRWVGVKHTLLLAKKEDQSIRYGQSDSDIAMRGLMTWTLDRFPETRIFEETIVPWTEWLLQGTGVKCSDIDLFIACDSNFATNRWQLGNELHRWFPSAWIIGDIEHHGMHQCQAFWQSGFKEAAVLTLDTCGEELKRKGGRKLSGTISRYSQTTGREVLSEFLFPDSSVGVFYDLATGHVGFRQHEQGKTMGLAPYGKPILFDQLRPRLQLNDNGSFQFMTPNEFLALMTDYVPAQKPGEELQQRHMDVAFAVQALVEEVVTNAFEAALRLTGLCNLAYAGGIALNSVANEVGFRQTRPRRFYVAPNPGDPGQALGCALWGAYERARWPLPKREVPEYLGIPYTVEEMESAIRRAGVSASRPIRPAEIIADCIANGHIIARFDGRAEFGPRALGNRSILCDPRRPDMKDYLNSRVKYRESFRPFAPSVLEEHAAKWFNIEGRNSYMLRVCQVRAEVAQRIPAVVHVDGSARVQTVAREENPGFFEVIEAFFKKTEIPLLLNTSFNIAGKPIVETPDHAVACFTQTAIDILLLGPFVLSKEPLEVYRTRSR